MNWRRSYYIPVYYGQGRFNPSIIWFLGILRLVTPVPPLNSFVLTAEVKVLACHGFGRAFGSVYMSVCSYTDLRAK